MHRNPRPVAVQSGRSVDVSRAAQGGRAQEDLPMFGLSVQRRPIERVRRGANASKPIATFPDPVSPGRLPVLARSGNDDAELQDSDALAADNFSVVGDKTKPEIAADNRNQVAGIAVGALATLALLTLLK